ncbi:unnamed protein product [Closterium sp. Naga37s-1]|nr:unnamed protein product [Closterium sp. Naga37s-1]
MAAFELEAFPGRTLHVLLFRDVANSAYVLPRHPQTHPPRASRSHPPAPSARPSRRRDPLRPSSAVTSFPHSSPVVVRDRATAHAHAHSWRTPVFPLPTPLPPPGSAESHCITEAALALRGSRLAQHNPCVGGASHSPPPPSSLLCSHLPTYLPDLPHLPPPPPFSRLLLPSPASSSLLPPPSPFSIPHTLTPLLPLPPPYPTSLPPPHTREAAAESAAARDLLSQLQSGTMHPEVAFLNATLVPGTFPVLVAAHKALTSAATGCLKSRTLHSELVFNYAASKHVSLLPPSLPPCPSYPPAPLAPPASLAPPAPPALHTPPPFPTPELKCPSVPRLAPPHPFLPLLAPSCPSMPIRESLQRCGVAAGTTALLAARFDATQDEWHRRDIPCLLRGVCWVAQWVSAHVMQMCVCAVMSYAQ